MVTKNVVKNPCQDDDEAGAEEVQLRKKSAASHDDEVDIGRLAQVQRSLLLKNHKLL